MHPKINSQIQHKKIIAPEKVFLDCLSMPVREKGTRLGVNLVIF